jgi:hypothetical protein
MNLHDLLPAVIIVVVTILAAAFSGSILSSIMQTQCVGGAMTNGECGTGGSAYNTSTVASNVTRYGLTSITNISQQMPNIGLILVVAVIIGILVGSFLVYQKRQ